MSSLCCDRATSLLLAIAAHLRTPSDKHHSSTSVGWAANSRSDRSAPSDFFCKQQELIFLFYALVGLGCDYAPDWPLFFLVLPLAGKENRGGQRACAS